MAYDYQGSRREWFLPLFGGAEMNRIRPPKIKYFTSLPYPIMTMEGVIGKELPRQAAEFMWFDTSKVTSRVLEGTLKTAFNELILPPDAGVVRSRMTVGILKDAFTLYAMPPDYTQVRTRVHDGTMKRLLITYANWPVEPVRVQSRVLTGTLT